MINSAKDLAGGMEHSDLAPDSSAGEDVCVLVSEFQCGPKIDENCWSPLPKYSYTPVQQEDPHLPGKCVEIFLDIFVFILHEDGAAVDINDTNRVAAARGNQAGGFCWVRGIRFENNLKQD